MRSRRGAAGGLRERLLAVGKAIGEASSGRYKEVGGPLGADESPRARHSPHPPLMVRRGCGDRLNTTGKSAGTATWRIGVPRTELGPRCLSQTRP